MRRPLREPGRWMLVLGLCALAAPAVNAQDADEGFDPAPVVSPLAVFNNRLVREVRLEGLHRVSTQLVRNTLRTLEGRPLSLETVSQDVRNLHRLGEFRQITASAELFEDGSLAVIFAFVEAPILEDIVVEGNVEIESDDIARAAAGARLTPGTPIDDFRVDQAARAVEELYRRRGYFSVEVTVDEAELSETGVVVLRVREGQQARVARIDLVGNTHVETKRLRPSIRTRTTTWFTDGPFDPQRLGDDTGALVQYYFDHGYLDARVDWKAIPSPNGREIIVQFLIEEGELYTLRRITAVSATGEPLTVFDEEQIRSLAPIKPGDALERPLLDRSADTIRDAYWRLGYVDAALRTSERHVTGENDFAAAWERAAGRDATAYYDLLVEHERPVADVRFVIDEGRRFRTGDVTIRGNTLTKADVIRRELRITPGDPLDRVGVEETQRRLTQSRLFAQPSPSDPNQGPQVQIQPEDPANPGTRDVLVEITETNTSAFNFGAQVSSDSGLGGFVEARFWNFDLTDAPRSLDDWTSGRSFRGGGQSLTLRASPGTEIQNYAISYSDPYLFEKDLSFSTGASLTDREFRTYDENRRSGRLSLGRRFGERWTGSASLRLDSVELDGIDPDAPVDLFAVQDRNTFLGTGFRLTRTSVPSDQRLAPGKGSRSELSIEQVSGDFSFTKIGFQHAAYLTVGQDFLGRRQIVSTKLSANYIPQEGEAPVYERYYLGGRSFRGFDFRGVSPRGIRNNDGLLGDDVVGGDWSFFFGLQYEHPLVGVVPGPRGRVDAMISVVFFLDTGTVQRDFGFDEYRASVGTGLRVRVPQLTSVPLAFDVAVPIADENGDQKQLFSFSVDLPF